MIPLVYHPCYSQLPLPKEHRYPINKYRLLFEEITRLQATDKEWAKHFVFHQPEPLSVEQVKQTHCEDYVDSLVTGSLPAAKMRRIGFPWSDTLIQRTLTSSAGTLLTAELAVEHGIAIHLSGGYHHAHRDYGSGFCLFNDLVIAANHALTHEQVDKVLIVDSDVHHGDGTATLCADNPDIVTVSFHCEKNFPARKPGSDYDIGLAKETGDEEFLSHFADVVEMAINFHQPDLIIYDAGVDIHVDDELGFFNVSTQALYERDCKMFELATNKRIPIGCVVGGGYRSNHHDLVPVHLQLLNAAIDTYKPR
ncbi:histone deacetylase [Vibrio mexicanus]|uniref:histone deacetylase family protein n=1 Tax=Vibrio mexicanus TaxID=1004326 RepID=UPI00063C3276|nr:histone deacetylase [Vibrio mexicanus]